MVRKFIKEINEKRGVTVILTSHDMADLLSLANRVIVIGHGNKLYDGTFDGIKKRFSDHKKLEIVYKNLKNVPIVKGTEILEKAN